ncbi:hypothetical protein HPB50_012076 [Hyalomma asiaticum]|uniref:Uncharacterized protein n=1 Tax=Hyalomma asiaticum TaxID=266040 RepID=A0ACB7SLA9_HYAAI|nr:hypothetical protein HPB50_012076 [Hyalomma asiaticum]
MKKNRNEMVAAAVRRYLKGRQYMDCDSSKKADVRLQQSVADFALNGTVASETGAKNVLSYSPVNKDAQAVEQQFSKLKNFIADACEPFKSELTFVLFPMFVHLYLELVSNGQKSSVQFSHEKINGDAQGVGLQQHLGSSTTARGSSADSKQAPSVEHCKDSLTSLRQAIKNVKEGPPCIPSICLYTVNDRLSGLCSVSQAEDGSLLACGFEDSSIRLWSLLPRPLQTIQPDVDVSRVRLHCDADEMDHCNSPQESPHPKANVLFHFSSDSKVLRAHSGPVYGLDFLPGKEVMLSCSEDTTGNYDFHVFPHAVRAWSLKTHSNVAIYRGHSYPIWDIDVGPFGLYFATASKDSTAKIWTLERTYPLRILAGHNMDVDCVKFHPNSNYVATGSSDRCLRLWSVQDGRVVRSLPSHRGTIFALAFSPDGQLLASAGEDRRIRVWDLGSSTMLKELRGHTDAVYSISFSRDGSVLASGGAEPLVHLWDLRRSVGSSPREWDKKDYLRNS